MKIRRALLSVSDKEGMVELAQALAQAGAELVATGRTAKVLEEAGLTIRPIENFSGSPEAFQGRMKTLSFKVCSGILFRRDDSSDLADAKRLGIEPIDCVVVNFYPFEKAPQVEEIDIGGPTLVRAAAKNAPAVLVLTEPGQYGDVLRQLRETGGVDDQLARRCAAQAWDRVSAYDAAISERMGFVQKMPLRYGENPHQSAAFRVNADSPIDWVHPLTSQVVSYNNVLDLSAAYELANELALLQPMSTSVVIVKHNNPCGVACVPKDHEGSLEKAQFFALESAWQGDPLSAFGGVVVFTDPLGASSAQWLTDRFVELIAAPDLTEGAAELQLICQKRKKLRALAIRGFGTLHVTDQSHGVVGGTLFQSLDVGLGDDFEPVTHARFPVEKRLLAKFGIAVCRALKSNALALVREMPGQRHCFQLIGAGQGQPNRVDALKILAIPRAESVLRESGGTISECVLVSDAFFPFRDSIDVAYASGITAIVQPGGSLKDADVIAACNEHRIAMVFTKRRHFRH